MYHASVCFFFISVFLFFSLLFVWCAFVTPAASRDLHSEQLLKSMQIKKIGDQKLPLCRYSCSPIHRTSVRCSTKLPPAFAQFSEPSKLKMQVDNFRVKLWESFPEPVKEFPWKKAKDMVLHRLLVLGEQVLKWLVPGEEALKWLARGEEALKWSMVAVFVFSSLSDVILSFSRNRELMIPFGLFIGCAIADFFKETSDELFQNTKKVQCNWNLFAIAAFVILVKVMSLNYSIGGQLLLSHVGNGALMMTLYKTFGLHRKLHEERDLDDPSMANVVQD